MNNIFNHASSYWVKYSEYELKKDKNGVQYIKPAPKAKPTVYDPLKNSEEMVLDALNIGLILMNRAKEEVVTAAVLEFAQEYGLFGFITALPTTPNFMDYDAVYLPKNHFIKEESMPVTEYAHIFFPFEKPDFIKRKDEVQFSVSSDKADRDMLALAMTFSDEPMAMNMSFQREYSERYDWLLTQFKDWAFTFLTSYLYYEDYDRLDETARDLYRLGMAAFGGIAPTYHIALYDKPTLVWDFHSLLLGIQMMFSFALTDENSSLRACKHCTMAYIANRPNAQFCSARCKNQYNVYKSRAKKDEQI